jgi:hypothetical protein
MVAVSPTAVLTSCIVTADVGNTYSVEAIFSQTVLKTPAVVAVVPYPIIFWGA